MKAIIFTAAIFCAGCSMDASVSPCVPEKAWTAIVSTHTGKPVMLFACASITNARYGIGAPSSAELFDHVSGQVRVVDSSMGADLTAKHFPSRDQAEQWLYSQE